VRFEDVAAVTMKITVSWDVVPGCTELQITRTSRKGPQHEHIRNSSNQESHTFCVCLPVRHRIPDDRNLQAKHLLQ
jgi:hypothetical protein